MKKYSGTTKIFLLALHLLTQYPVLPISLCPRFLEFSSLKLSSLMNWIFSLCQTWILQATAFWKNKKKCQNGTFEPLNEMWNLFWPKAFFWSIMSQNGNKKNYPKHFPGSTRSRIYAGKSTKRWFLKKSLARMDFFLF